MVVAEFDSKNPEGVVLAGSTPSSLDAAKLTNGNGADAKAGGMPEFKSVHRVATIPVIVDGIQVFENVVNSNSVTKSIYGTVGGIAAKSYDLASPILARSKPIVDKADSIVNSGLDIIESKYPYPFKASTGEIIDGVKQPAYETVARAQGVYDARIAPYVHTDIVQRAIEQIYNLNSGLTQGVVTVKNSVISTTYSAAEQLQAIAAALIEQLHHLSLHGKDLPPKIQESVSTAYSDVRGIMAEKEKNTQQKTVDLANYVKSIIQPEIEKAQAYVFKAKDQTVNEVEQISNGAQQKAGELTNGAH